MSADTPARQTPPPQLRPEHAERRVAERRVGIKMLVVIALTTSGALFTNLWVLTGVLLFSCLCALAYRAPLLRLFARWHSLLWLLGLVALLQIVFVRSGSPELVLEGRMLASSAGLQGAASVVLRYLIILVAGFIMSTATMGEVMRVLLRLRLPYRFVFAVVISAQFIPRFAQLFRNALAAMQLRGLNVKKLNLIRKCRVYLYLIFPVIASSLVAATDLAIAMETRGFGAYKKRSSLT